MDGLVDILGILIPSTQGVAWVWLTFVIAKHLHLAVLLGRFARLVESSAWEHKLRKTGATDKQVRDFIRDFALAEAGRSP